MRSKADTGQLNLLHYNQKTRRKNKKKYKIETDMVAAGKSVESVLKKKREGYGGKDL